MSYVYGEEVKFQNDLVKPEDYDKLQAFSCGNEKLDGYLHDEFKQDTIAAIATGMTDAGIGIVRISGEHAVAVGDAVFRKAGKKLCDQKSHTMHYGKIFDDGELIDEALVSVMLAPHSYTGEDTVEINCHGGMYVTRRILQAVLAHGARLAEPGEFTKRAFLNGKMDLSKAEAVMDLIHSKNEFALKNSLDQLNGSLYDRIKKLREDIIYEIAFIESALDDPEHISLDGYPERLEEKVNDILQQTRQLETSFQSGRIRREGVRTVIVGRPNAGKSSLLNILSGEDRAIVTDIAGTTRDVLEESVRIGDMVLNLVDTAGIRDASNEVEKIGVSKAKKYAEDADLILYVVDSSLPMDENDEEIISLIQGKNVIVLLNKSDLETVTTREDIVKKWQKFVPSADIKNAAVNHGNHIAVKDTAVQYPHVINICAKETAGMNTDSEISTRTQDINTDSNISTENTDKKFSDVWKSELTEELHRLFFYGTVSLNDDVIITNLRHVQELKECEESLALVKQSIENGMPEDFFSIDLSNAYLHLGNIIGEEINDDLMNEIFSKFCMGK